MTQSLAAYVPEHLRRGEVQPVEILDGTFLFADISGFTALFEAAAAEGSGGTEIATQTLNRCFAKFIEAIETGGGSILKFGGDALLTYVPGGDASCRAGVWISTQILRSIQETGRTQIGKKKMRMGVKVAVHRGRGLGINAGLGGGRLEYVPLGTAFEELAAIEDVSERGEIVASKHTAELAGGEWGDHVGGFCLLKRFPFRVVPSSGMEIAEQTKVSEERYRAYVPDAVADRIDRLGGESTWLCEHRFVTPIFTEIRGLVPMAQKALRDISGAGADLTEFLSKNLTMLREEMRRRGGILARTDIAVEGLKAISLFGAAAVVERQEISAIEAAIAFRDRIGKMRKDVRMGIAAGKSFACVVGSERRCDFTVIGDVMNTSARLMAAAPWGEIFSLQRMTEKTGGMFRASPCKIVAKGKKLPIEVSLVHSLARQSRTAASISDTFIGRYAEREQILAAFEKAGKGSCEHIELAGEAGLGKTAILDWAVSRWEERGGKVWKGACVPHGSGDAFLPWRGIVSQALGLAEPLTESKILTRLKALDGSSADGLATILGMPVGTSDVKLLRRIRVEALRELIRREPKPVLVILEDLHWADSNSLTLVADMDESGLAAPVVTTTRPSHVAGHGGNVRRLMLAPFTLEETRSLAEDILKGRQLPERRVEEVYAKAAGNPLFISEIFRMILERDDEAEIPDSIHAVVLCRTDRLAEFDRKILRAAAVIGPMFEPEFLFDLHTLGGMREEIEQSLKTLTTGEFVDPAEHLYEFHHETIRNAVYESMSHQLRTELHRQIGALGEKREKESWWLAHHFESGRDDERAVLHHERAAAGAVKSRLHEPVRFHTTRALDILGRAKRPDADARTAVLKKIRGKALKQMGLYRAAIRDYAGATKAATDPASAIDAANFVSSCQRLMGRHRDSLKTGLRALRIARTSGQLVIEKDILNTLSTTYWYLGEYRRCIKYGEEAYSLECRSDGEPAGTGLFLVGNAHVKLANIVEAKKAFQNLIDIAERRDHGPSIAYAAHGMGYCELLAGNFAQALAFHRRGYDIRKKMGEPRALAYSTLNLAECFIEMGLAPMAHPFLRQGEQVVARIEDNNLQSDLDRIYGLFDLSTGRSIQALGRFRRAYEIAQDLGFFEMKIKAMLGLTRSYLVIGDVASARRGAKQLARSAARAGMDDMTIWAGCLAALAERKIRCEKSIRQLKALESHALAAQLLPLALRIRGVSAALNVGRPTKAEHGPFPEEHLNSLAERITDQETRRKFTLRWSAVVGSGGSSAVAWLAI